ncbi:MAG TPA: glycoside hydrolase family 3 C-terminal domain-containing protein [Candidatus Solibacter sp.]|nr:glycoside hydrolase family 3 C-terminal domain-containing protein [Candidatus Solibacter sp.]
MTRKILFPVAVVFLFCAGVFSQSTTSKADVEKRVDSLLKRMTLEEKIDYLGGMDDFYIRPIARLEIPALRMSDGPMGVHDYGLTTAYSAGIALAASWDADLARRVGEAMGKDARARGVHFILGPGMNIYRAPMCGRNFEYLGEDPFLASRMAVGLVEGIQSQQVIATAKHYAGNNQEYERNKMSSDIDERTLREIYLPAFEASVREAKVGAVMDSYNLVNGVHSTQNSHLNIDVLRDDWGFDGIVMSDWDATYDGVASANNGLDLEMPAGRFMNKATLMPAIKDGKVSEATIDEKVRRILRMAIEHGFLDRPQTDTSVPLYSQEGREATLEEAREGMVLLKNERNLLPLDKTKLKTIAVIGPDAFPSVPGGGGSSQTKPYNSVSFLEGVSNYVGTKVNVLYAIDVPPLDDVFDHSEFVVSPGGERGLKGEYFDNEELHGPAAMTRTDPTINFRWGDDSFAEGHPTDHFSVRWTGYFIPTKTDDYKFFSSADDGVRLFIDDQQVINDWQPHSETMDSYAARFEAGHAYKVRFEYYESVGGARAGFGVVSAAESVGRETKALAAKSDVVVICVGFDPATEGEGADRTFALPGGQDELIRQIVSVNKNVIVVLTAGGNVDMTKWIDGVPALIHAWYPGQEGGTALAQILFGEYSPSGKLPVSLERRWEDNPAHDSYYPVTKGDLAVKYSEGVFLGYRGYDKSGVKPMFPFGFGLSYTTFAYKNISISPAAGDLSQPVKVAFDVVNTGKRAGAEVAEVYVSDGHAKVPRPMKELKGFSRVELKPGETRRVAVTLDRRAFSYYDVDKKDWAAEPGKFEILVGGSSDAIQLRSGFTLNR